MAVALRFGSGNSSVSVSGSCSSSDNGSSHDSGSGSSSGTILNVVFLAVELAVS